MTLPLQQLNDDLKAISPRDISTRHGPLLLSAPQHVNNQWLLYSYIRWCLLAHLLQPLITASDGTSQEHTHEHTLAKLEHYLHKHPPLSNLWACLLSLIVEAQYTVGDSRLITALN